MPDLATYTGFRTWHFDRHTATSANLDLQARYGDTAFILGISSEGALDSIALGYNAGSGAVNFAKVSGADGILWFEHPLNVNAIDTDLGAGVLEADITVGTSGATILLMHGP